MIAPTKDLLLARRNLEEITGYELLEDLVWDEIGAGWILKFRLNISAGANTYSIPDSTEWYATIPENYPWGKIHTYPAKEKGIALTFQHQNHNNIQTQNKWRSGDLCLNTTFGSFSLRGFNSEPTEASERLFWHVYRCKMWLEAAINDQLSLNGQLFELPSFPLSFTDKYYYSEDEATYSKLISTNKKSGQAEAIIHPGKSSFFITVFKDFCGKVLYSNTWNDSINNHKAKSKNIVWLLIDFIPVSCPWEAPATWERLYHIGNEHNVDFQKIITDIFIKGYRQSADCLILGFPVPEKIGEEPFQIHWQPISLPVKGTLKGFRPGQEAQELANRAFHKNKKIEWMDSQNGNIGSISARGKYSDKLSQAKVLLIGAGAVGSVIGECLIRGTCRNLTIMDKDKLELGNMSRHTLTLKSLDQCKAQELSKRLNDIFPETRVSFNRSNIEQILDSDKSYLQQFDLIIDATGNDQALHYLSNHISGSDKKFVSISLGLNAKRLFHYQYQGAENLEFEFKKEFSPWLEQEIEIVGDSSLPREGIGCWHPLFPARVDDVWMMSTAAIKLIEAYYVGSDSSSTFIVLNTPDGDMFQGIDVIRN
ncbi:ThiF family adenylyltransferase [Dyadobacter sp.]|uniref:ThiF family adenylyltransferase n=1 Tax=Dyadobacter sp. TaxID=1914288 RepID=UPI003F70E89C